jgi:hypothetical protein
LGQQRGEGGFSRQQIAQLLLDHVADHAFGFGAQNVQRVGRHPGVGSSLQ